MDLKDVKEIANLMKNIKSGNMGDALRNAANLLKSKQFRKKLILKIVQILMPFIVVVIVAVSVFSVFNSVADKLNELKGNLVNFTTGVWKWLTNDYWIKMDEEVDIVKIQDDPNTSEDETVVEQQTIVDSYMEEIERMGLSLKSMRLLGEADYTTENPLEDENNKKLVQKYLKEFIRADIISQEIHRRRTGLLYSEKLVNPDNEDEIDGGVFLYRSKNELSTNQSLEKSKMSYTTEEEFQNLIDSNDESAEKYFTVDKNTGDLLIAQVTTTVVEQKVDNGGWSQIDKQVQVTKKACNYKTAIAKYTLPFEFLVNLCTVSQNPEFVYRVALMARDTDIRLVVLDDVTKDVSEVAVTTTTTTLQNIGSDSVEGASVLAEIDSTTTTKTTVTQTNPNVVIEEVKDSWIYQGKKVYTKTYNPANEVTSGPVVDTNFSKPDRLLDTGRAIQMPSTTPTTPEFQSPFTNPTTPGFQSPFTENPTTTEASNTLTTSLKVYEASYVSKTSTTTTTSTESNSYDSGVVENEVIKSDDFLGLLRNDDGKPVDIISFKDGARDQFKKDGKNVAYTIPNSTIEEMPLNKLTSGAEMLFSLLRQNSKTQELEQLMRYLLQFPDGRDYGVTVTDIETIFAMENPSDGSVADGSIIVKTDMPGAAPAVTKEQLIQIINNYFRSQQTKANALSLVDTLIENQNLYKVNAVFELAILQKETSVGTANTNYVREQNNWTSYNLGHVYARPQDSVTASMKSIATGSYYFTQGKYTIKEIGYTYCPNTETYPTQGDDWVACVSSYVVSMYNSIGLQVSTEGSSTSSGSGVISQGSGGGTTYASSSGRTYTEYKQFDPAWAMNSFAGGTMKNSGCSITAIAIVLSGYGNNVGPEGLRSHCNGNMVNLCNLLTEYGVSSQRISHKLTSTEIVEQLKTGKPIIVLVGRPWASGTAHYMVLLDYKQEGSIHKVYVSNPGKNASHYNGWYNVDEIAPYTLPSAGSIFITE